jgi:hypothetical protein
MDTGKVQFSDPNYRENPKPATLGGDNPLATLAAAYNMPDLDTQRHYELIKRLDRIIELLDQEKQINKQPNYVRIIEDPHCGCGHLRSQHEPSSHAWGLCLNMGCLCQSFDFPF